MKTLLLSCFFTLFSFTSYIYAKSKDGVSFNFGLAQPSVTIRNSDGSDASYTGFGFTAGTDFPILEAAKAATTFRLGAKYLNLNNTANSNDQTEIANYLAPSAGLRLKFLRMSLGVDYNVYQAKHYWVGRINQSHEFIFSSLSYYAGVKLKVVKSFGVEILYTQESAQIQRGKISSDFNNPYSSSTFWLNFVYSTGDSSGSFLNNIFKD